jgi:hypothetical protein
MRDHYQLVDYPIPNYWVACDDLPEPALISTELRKWPEKGGILAVSSSFLSMM